MFLIYYIISKESFSIKNKILIDKTLTNLQGFKRYFLSLSDIFWRLEI